MSENTKRRINIGRVTVNTSVLTIFGVLSGMVSLTYDISVFGYIMLCAFLLNGFSGFVCILPVMGYILNGNFQNVVYYTGACVIITGLSYYKDKISNRKIKKAVCAFVLLITETIKSYSGGFISYYTIIIFLEITITYFLIDYYETFVNYFCTRKLRKTLSKKELASFLTVGFISLSVLSDYSFAYGIKPIGIIAVYIIFCTAILYGSTVSSVLGTFLGFLTSMSKPELLYIVSSYSISGFFAGLGKKHGKAGVILSFIITNAVITFYVNGSEKVLINIYEVFTAGILLCFTPLKKLENFKNGLKLLSPGKTETEQKRVDYMKESTYQKLMKLSDAFLVLSSALKTKPKEEKGVPTVAELTEEVKKRVCMSCGNCHYCWRAEDDYTGKIFERLIETAKRRGFVEGYDLSAKFKNYCINPGKVVLEANKIYELFRVNKIWESKIEESRKIIGSQLKDVSDIVEGFAGDFNNVYTFETDAERKIVTLLDSMGVTVSNVTVAKDAELKFYVKIGTRSSGKRKTGEIIILTAVNKVLSVNMKVKDCDVKDDCCYFVLVEDERFEVSTAVSKMRAVNQSASGDSYAVIKPGDGKMVIVLSDGMGTGEKAKEKSSETVNLLEALMKSGIKKESAIKLINSVLILKSFGDSFTTLDIMVIDLYTGEGEFVKTGGVASYIKRENKVITVNGDGVPTGILADSYLSNSKLKFMHGDVIVIMSDGVWESFCSEEELISSIKTQRDDNLKCFSDSVIQSAVNKKHTVSDDMTVIAVKIIEK